MGQRVQRRWIEDTDLAIGADPNNLSHLRRMDMPLPDQIVYSPASVYYTRGDGSRAGDGYATAQWIWDVIALNDLAAILAYLDGAEFATVYIKTDTRDGTYASPRAAMKVYSGLMIKPIVSGREGVPLARSPYALQTVSIMFKNLVEQPGYL